MVTLLEPTNLQVISLQAEKLINELLTEVNELLKNQKHFFKAQPNT